MRLSPAVLLLLLLAAPAAAEDIPLAAGTPDETVAYVRDSGRPGPTVLVVGGMHGSEPAGFRAAEQIRHWTVTKGRLVVLARANARGCRIGKRRIPAAKPYDLNRRFPSDPEKPVTSVPGHAIWEMVTRIRPDWVLDLHESFDYRYRTSAKRKTLGHTVICRPDGVMDPMAKKLAETANTGTRPGKWAWQVLASPIEGSLARAAADRLGSHAAIVESCRKDYLSVRIRHHRLVVHRLLRELEMLSAEFSPDTYFPAKRRRGEVRIALYNSSGTGGSSAWVVERCLPPIPNARSARVTAAAIRGGVLDQFDVVVFPGGTGSGTARVLGPKGREEVREFVKAGGGYLGICAGAYLATRTYSWSLGLLDAKVVDSRHWARGRGNVQIELTRTGRKLFASPVATTRVRYAQGPILAPGRDPRIPDFEPLAIYRTEIAKNGAPKGVMIDTPAIVRGRYGRGRVFVSSPHPEQTSGLHGYVRTAVLWLADRR